MKSKIILDTLLSITTSTTVQYNKILLPILSTVVVVVKKGASPLQGDNFIHIQKGKKNHTHQKRLKKKIT